MQFHYSRPPHVKVISPETLENFKPDRASVVALEVNWPACSCPYSVGFLCITRSYFSWTFISASSTNQYRQVASALIRQSASRTLRSPKTKHPTTPSTNVAPPLYTGRLQSFNAFAIPHIPSRVYCSESSAWRTDQCLSKAMDNLLLTMTVQ